jgi:hypothetical protein
MHLIDLTWFVTDNLFIGAMSTNITVTSSLQHYFSYDKQAEIGARLPGPAAFVGCHLHALSFR